VKTSTLYYTKRYICVYDLINHCVLNGGRGGSSQRSPGIGASDLELMNGLLFLSHRFLVVMLIRVLETLMLGVKIIDY